MLALHRARVIDAISRTEEGEMGRSILQGDMPDEEDYHDEEDYVSRTREGVDVITVRVKAQADECRRRRPVAVLA